MTVGGNDDAIAAAPAPRAKLQNGDDGDTTLKQFGDPMGAIRPAATSPAPRP
jgi:hypothetical protein